MVNNFISVTNYSTNKTMFMNINSISMISTNGNDVVQILCGGITVPVKETMEEIYAKINA